MLKKEKPGVVFDGNFFKLEYVHMRGEMKSYRFEISNQHENKFCSHDVLFRLHLKTTRYFDGHVQVFHFG